MSPNKYTVHAFLLIVVLVIYSCHNNNDKGHSGAVSDTVVVKDSATAENFAEVKVIHNPLERGRPVDLDTIDFQHANLDSLFSKLAYLKSFGMDEYKIKYTGTSPLVIKRYALYNIPDLQIAFRYASKGVDVIKPGQMYGDTLTIDRAVPLIGLKDADLRPFVYLSNSNIVFNKIFTTSTKKEKLIRVRLQSDELANVTAVTYQDLVKQLMARYKETVPKVNPQGDNRPSSYEWRTKTQDIQISFIKDGTLSYITLIQAFVNPDTKRFLPEFGN